MTYEELKNFINKKMRMSHLYQPVMLMTLLKNGGKCSQGDIASALLAHDESQIEYYTNITNNMVGRVLRKHDIVGRDNLTKEYSLLDFNQLTRDQVSDLIALCNQKLKSFLINVVRQYLITEENRQGT